MVGQSANVFRWASDRGPFNCPICLRTGRQLLDSERTNLAIPIVVISYVFSYIMVSKEDKFKCVAVWGYANIATLPTPNKHSQTSIACKRHRPPKRARTRSIFCSNSGTLNGLLTTSSIPLSLAVAICSPLTFAVTAMTGT
jgi:hypothetical protein